MDKLIEVTDKKVCKRPGDTGAWDDLLDAFAALDQGKSTPEIHALNRERRGMIQAQIIKNQKNLEKMGAFHSLLKKSLLIDARVDFDAYMQYVEFERDPDKRFYLPRRQALRPVVGALQKLENGDLDLLAISLPPGVGKTTVAIFFLTWLAGNYPDMPILGGSHSDSIMRGVYDECLRIMRGSGEYIWHEVFPELHINSTNANNMMIDLGTPKRFATLEFTSVGAKNAGQFRAEKLLYCDDLCSGIEEAMSADRLDKLWQLYSTDLKQRKIGNCAELHIATRWSVRDVIGRLEDLYAGDQKKQFIALPALNENDESNFDYGATSAGFSTEKYHDIKYTMDEVSWRALYMNQPIEREGLLYPEDDLLRYCDLPAGEPDAIIGICDTKDKGKDYGFMPAVYAYGDQYYLVDCICDNSNPEVVESRMTDFLYRNKVQLCRFESNSAGRSIAEKIQKEVKALGGITSITQRFTTENKETKIIVNSPFVKQHVLFKSKGLYAPNSDYGRMMRMLCSYTMAGKNKNDDVPDGMAMLAMYLQSFTKQKVEVFRRPC